MAKKTSSQGTSSSSKGVSKRRTKSTSKTMRVSNVQDDPVKDPVPGDGFSISAILEIGGKDFVLTGKAFEEGITVVYHKSYDEAINLGSVLTILDQIGGLIGISTLSTQVTSFINGLPDVLSGIINGFATADIRLTDFVIDTTGKVNDGKNTFEIGIGLIFVGTQPKVAGIQLNGFIVNFQTTSDKE